MPHFNISTLEQLKAIVNVGIRLSAPLHIGTSEGEAGYIGLRQSVALIRAVREETGFPVFLNADHFKSVEMAKKAIDAGYDSVNIDLSEKSYKENFDGTKEVVMYAKRKNPSISVEGELGYLRGSSKLQKEIIEIRPEDMVDVAEAEKYVAETGIDRLAPAIGNIHGIAANKPNLDFERIHSLREKLPARVAIVLHGGSGIADDDIKKAISLGTNNVHINTEIRVAYAQALRAALAKNPEETTPYKIFSPVIVAMEKIIEDKVRLFGAVNRV